MRLGENGEVGPEELEAAGSGRDNFEEGFKDRTSRSPARFVPASFVVRPAVLTNQPSSASVDYRQHLVTMRDLSRVAKRLEHPLRIADFDVVRRSPSAPAEEAVLKGMQVPSKVWFSGERPVNASGHGAYKIAKAANGAAVDLHEHVGHLASVWLTLSQSSRPEANLGRAR